MLVSRTRRPLSECEPKAKQELRGSPQQRNMTTATGPERDRDREIQNKSNNEQIGVRNAAEAVGSVFFYFLME